MLLVDGCQHIPTAPVFYERPQGRKNPYDIIISAHQTIQSYYYQPFEYLQNLDYSRETTRKQRSEAREAIARVAQVLVDHVDLCSLKIIQFRDKHYYQNLSVRRIAKLAKLNERRCFRALSALRKALYVDYSVRVKKNKDGRFYRQIAVKKLTKTFFYHLRITKSKLDQCMKYAANKIRAISRRLGKASFKATQELKAFSRRFRSPTYRHQHPKSSKVYTSPQSEAAFLEKRAKYEEAYNLLQENPGTPSHVIDKIILG